MPSNPPNLRIAVVGLGFVGLPLSLSYWQAGADVLGAEIDPQLRAELSQALTHHLEADDGKPIRDILADALASGRYRLFASAAEATAQADATIVTVGIPHGPEGLDLGPLRAALVQVAKAAPRGHLILLRSTVPPGTTRKDLYDLLRSQGRTVGDDIFVAYCPERIAEGRAFREFREMPVIMGAFDAASEARARSVIEVVTRAGVTTSASVEAAELSKVIENVQRDVNIAIAQELARTCEAGGIDVFEVIRLANTHSRVHLLEPGPGVGGFCLPLALSYFLPFAQEHGVVTPTLLAARSTNAKVPPLLAERALAHARALAGNDQPRIAVFGLAMKDFSNDARLSPAVEVCQYLVEAGAEVRAVDPAVPTRFPFQGEDPAWAVSGAQALLLLTRQSGLEAWLEDLSPLQTMHRGALVVDARNWLKRGAEDLAALGLRYWKI
ncbi:MAG: nucleotide sugar dehydrogenase [Thermaerobacter sp.]|nr:nucleotide sugar dehydrogenase [Thermaerobacter sp.]